MNGGLAGIGCLVEMDAAAENRAGYKITFGNMNKVVVVAAAVGVVVMIVRHN